MATCVDGAEMKLDFAFLTDDSKGPIQPSSWISKQLDRCGGDACVRDTRIPVWVLVNYRRLGGTDAELLTNYPSLTATDLKTAWAYGSANANEIESAIRENEEGEPENAE